MYSLVAHFSLYADLKIRQVGNAVPSPEKGFREEKIPWGEADRAMHFNKITYRKCRCPILYWCIFKNGF